MILNLTPSYTYGQCAVLRVDNATDIDMGTNISDHDVDANTFNHIYDLPQYSSSDLSESDDEGVEPCRLKDKICSWALTIGISLVHLLICCV